MIIHPLPNPIAFSIGPLAVHWYGLMYLAGFILFLIAGRIRIKQPHMRKIGWTTKNLDDMLFYGVLGVIIGGRLGEVFFYNPKFFLANPMQIFAVWNGGMSYHGGFLGVMFAAWLWGKKNDHSLFEVLDLIAPLVPLGYIAGRIGNFINAELPGRIADPSLPWAMIWPNVDMQPRHPSPLYQALIDGVLLFVILWIYSRKPRPQAAVSGMYALLYGCSRFITEYFRTPDYIVSFFGINISAGQMLSIPMVIFGIVLLYIAYSRENKKQMFDGL